MAQEEVYQAQVTVLADAEPLLQSSQTSLLVAAAHPSEAVESSQVQSMLATDSIVDIEAFQLQLFVVARGREYSPKIRCWTYTMDGHDYYILRLGMQETLVYDVASEEWYLWGSANDSVWRASAGLNWIGGMALGASSSDVIVGDDTTGTLYFLDPFADDDDHPLTTGDVPLDRVPFERIMSGQVVTPREYSSFPCYGVELMGSIGQSAEGTVELEISDDRGQSFTSVGEITVPEDDYETRLNWLSLGSMQVPGRIFKITDNGCLKRIDSLEMRGPDAG